MSTSAFFLLLTLAISFLLRPSSSAAMAEENLMRQLWRTELVRLAGYGEERLSTVLVTGSLLYQAHHLSSGSNHLTISYAKGVKVAVTCKNDEGRMKRSEFSYGTTDEFGDFIINIPSQLHAIPNFEDSCFVMILKTQRNSHHHRQISISNPIRIKLSHVGNTIRIYTTGTVELASSTLVRQLAWRKKIHCDAPWCNFNL